MALILSVIALADTPSPSPSPSATELLRDQIIQLTTSLQSGGNAIDWVLVYILIGGVVAIIWFANRGLARRDHPRAVAIYRRFDPQMQALRTWLSNSPATVIYVACWTATTVVVMGSPPLLVNILTRTNSTNIAGIVSEPIRSLAVSALLVADNGAGYLFYLAAYMLLVMRLEHRLGAPRTIIVWLVSHCGGSLLIVWLEIQLINAGVAPERLAVTADVGVSYVMVGSMGAYIWLVSKKWRPWYLAALAIGILGPLVFSQKLWDLGHFLATVLGLITGYLVLKVGASRPGLKWRDLACASPRPLHPSGPKLVAPSR